MVKLLRSALLLIIFVGLWLLFVFQITPSELIAGAASAIIAFIAALAATRAVPLPFRPSASWFKNSWRIPGMVLQDTLILVKHLWTPPHSSFENVQLRPPRDQDEGHAQRTIALIEVSMCPNTVVVHIDEEQQIMSIHNLQPQPTPEFIRDLQQA